LFAFHARLLTRLGKPRPPEEGTRLGKLKPGYGTGSSGSFFSGSGWRQDGDNQPVDELY